MQNTIKAKNGVTLAKSVANVPAPKVAAPAAASGYVTPVSGQWVKHSAKANQQYTVPTWLTVNNAIAAQVNIVPAPWLTPTMLQSFIQQTSGRYKIATAHLWGFAQGHTPGAPVNLQGVTNYCANNIQGYSLNGYYDLVALLNGTYGSKGTPGKAWCSLQIVPLQGAAVTK